MVLAVELVHWCMVYMVYGIYIKVDKETIMEEKRPVATEVKDANEIN